MKAIIINTENNWLKTYKAVNILLSYGIHVLWSKEPIKQGDMNTTAGTFLIPIEKYQNIWKNNNTLNSYKKLNEKKITAYLQSEEINFGKIEISRPVNVMKLDSANVALYQDSGCFNHALVISSSGFDVNWVSGMEISAGTLDGYDILFSGGGGGAKKANINRENLLLASMGIDGAKKIASFVHEGGTYFGCCGGSYIGSVVRERFKNWWHPAKKYMTILNAEDWHIDEYSDSGFKSPGQGTFIAKNSARDNPIMFGLPEFFECVHWNGPVWTLLEAAVEKASSPISLIEFENVSQNKFTPSEFYKTNVIRDETKFKNTGIVKACIKKKTAIAQGFYGIGLAVLSGSHPEMKPEYGLKLSDDKLWDSARILSNACFWAASNNTQEKKKNKRKNNFIIPFDSDSEEYMNKIKVIKENISNLKKNNKQNKPSWLNPKLYSLSYGLIPEKMYIKTLTEFIDLCVIILSEFKKIDELVKNSIDVINRIKNKIKNTHDKNEINSLNILIERGAFSITRYFNMLGRQKEPLWDQGGDQQFQGIYSLINISFNKTEEALKKREYLLKNKVDLYELVDNPFSLISSASSRLNNALILLRVNKAALEKFIRLSELYEKQ